MSKIVLGKSINIAVVNSKDINKIRAVAIVESKEEEAVEIKTSDDTTFYEIPPVSTSRHGAKTPFQLEFTFTNGKIHTTNIVGSVKEFIAPIAKEKNNQDNSSLKKIAKETLGRGHRKDDKGLKNLHIFYDFKTGEITTLPKKKSLKIKEGGFVTFRVLNINPFIYNVIINDEAINFNTESRATFVGSFTPRQAPATGDAPAEAQAGARLAGAKLDSTLLDSLKNMALCSDTLEIYYNKKITELYPDMDILKAEREILNKKIAKILGKEGLVTEEDIINKMSSQTAILDSLLKEISNEDEKKRFQKDRDLYVEKIRKGAQIWTKILNISFVMSSGTVQAKNADIIRFKLQIKKGTQDAIQPQEYDVRIKGGWKFDFSTGIIATRLRDQAFTTIDTTVFDTTFFVEPDFTVKDSITAITAVSKKEIIQNNKGDFDYGLSVLGHFNYRTGGWFSCGFSLGALLDDETNLKYLFGGSLILGFDQRLILSGGIAIGRVKRLAPPLTVGGFHTGSGNVPREDVTEKDWFIGVTYNLGKAKTSTGK